MTVEVLIKLLEIYLDIEDAVVYHSPLSGNATKKCSLTF